MLLYTLVNKGSSFSPPSSVPPFPSISPTSFCLTLSLCVPHLCLSLYLSVSLSLSLSLFLSVCVSLSLSHHPCPPSFSLSLSLSLSLSPPSLSLSLPLSLSCAWPQVMVFLQKWLHLVHVLCFTEQKGSRGEAREGSSVGAPGAHYKACGRTTAEELGCPGAATGKLKSQGPWDRIQYGVP